MLTPRPSPERRPEMGDVPDDDIARQSFVEPRSFAVLDDAPETETRWPQAWETMSAADFIRLPADEIAAGLDPDEAYDRRALIVIPCLNEAKVIESVIARMLDDDGLIDPLVLVADGGSTDGTQDIVSAIALRDPRVRLLHNPRKLQSAGLNLAAQALGGDRPWLVRVDAHADYPPNYASTLIAEARRTGADSVVVTMDTQGTGFFQRAAAAAQNSVLGTGGSAHRSEAQAGWVDHGHHALFDLASYEAIGGYDESFSHNEDAELDHRLTREGGRIWLTDKARIVYHPRSTPQALWKQYFSYGKGRARTVLKHFTPLKFRQAIPLGIAPAVGSLLLSPIFWAFAVPALVWMAAALSYGLILGAKKRDPAVAIAGVAAMIMHLSWSAGFWKQLFTNRPPPEPIEMRRPELGVLTP